MTEMNSRQQLILQRVIDRGQISVVELAQMTKVSEVTIRQDLNALEARHFLQRKHGYAIPVKSENSETRIMNHYACKQQLAEFAASGVRDGETIFIENGSCNVLLAQILSARAVTLITVSSYIARHLIHGEAEVILPGGHFQQSSETMVGPLTLRYLREMTFSRAFIGVDGWHPDIGFSGRDSLRAEVANTILSLGQEVIVLTDSAKFGTRFDYPIGAHGGISRVITDAAIPDKAQKILRRQFIQLDSVPVHHSNDYVCG